MGAGGRGLCSLVYSQPGHWLRGWAPVLSGNWWSQAPGCLASPPLTSSSPAATMLPLSAWSEEAGTAQPQVVGLPPSPWRGVKKLPASQGPRVARGS